MMLNTFLNGTTKERYQGYRPSVRLFEHFGYEDSRANAPKMNERY